jgi:hypothetical protein
MDAAGDPPICIEQYRAFGLFDPDHKLYSFHMNICSSSSCAGGAALPRTPAA